jgi:DNA-binding NarL/FixJ family response regulator
MAIRILLVEDEAHTREHLAAALGADERLEVVGAEPTLERGRAALVRLRPDVLVTDLQLPDGDGTSLIRAISESGLPTLPMVITVFGDEKTVVGALEAGALGYLLKGGSQRYLVDSVLELHGGGSPISPAIARHLLRRFRDEGGASVAEVSPDAPHLSAREQQVLDYLCKGFTFAEAARLLDVTPHTVATYVRRIYRKLAVRSRAEAVYEAQQLGLLKDR